MEFTEKDPGVLEVEGGDFGLYINIYIYIFMLKIANDVLPNSLF